MAKKKSLLILLGVVALVILIAVTVIALNASPEPKSIDQSSANQSEETPETDTVQPQQPSEPAAKGTDAEGELLDQETTDSIFLNARQAAEAFVSQPMDEETATRQDRLRRFFTPISKAIAAKPPITSDSYFTTKVTTLQTDWYILGGKRMGVIVYLNVGVNTGFAEYEEKQSWVLELINYKNVWTSNSITKSDMPYIEGAN